MSFFIDRRGAYTDYDGAASVLDEPKNEEITMEIPSSSDSECEDINSYKTTLSSVETNIQVGKNAKEVWLPKCANS